MQCPVCGSDTASASPRCIRCNAPLGDATARDDATVRDGAGPVPPPEGDDRTTRLSPEPWDTPHTEDEQTTRLSPEPWEQPGDPWGPPQIWQPPPPRRRRRATPWVAIAVGGWILAVAALAIVFWPGDEEPAPEPTAGVAQNTTAVPTPGPTTAETTGSAQQQAAQIDAVLGDMTATRGELGGIVAAGCDRDALQRIRDSRQEQLDRAEALEVDALPDGEALKNALTSALRISLESNDLYLSHAPGCPSESAAEDVNSRATRAKTELVGYWNRIAAQYGLSPRDPSTI
ncbi:hypothetical protein [Thermomonospora cellulosilytica]|uniref:Uncharacterized protein n=1 Tax=Thermomonospora cellulosilytica TaxID=1411118 RepID=A0A7W3MWI6_9ACTN|nr:hypothetical protein [Thermomonospora cellulosilytica]MBA9003215.1 hypothetical protein [Thermomonospora cellulosilytica]